jgi:spermidine synthase
MQPGNAEAIARRLDWLKSKPQGMIYNHISALHRIVIRKEGTELRLFFSNPKLTDYLSGRMSEIDIDDPLYLIAPYTQALLLPLLWNENPERIYMLGFAGGRVSLVFHHFLPNVVIDNTDIDADVIPMAEKYFAIQRDERQNIIIQDGREYLQERPDDPLYDFILVDAFRGLGVSPSHLSTLEFFALCKQRLKPGGVVAVNLVEGDNLFLRRITTLLKSFEYVYFLVDEDARVAFASDTPVAEGPEKIELARAMQRRFDFPIPFVHRAIKLKRWSEYRDYLSQLGDMGQPLKDGGAVAAPIVSPPPSTITSARVGRNDLCPCGSGKKFKRCHGSS